MPEPSLNAYLAGSFGVPAVMLSGDDYVIREASPVLGDIEYAQVKKSTGFFSGEHMPLSDSRRLPQRHRSPGRAGLQVALDPSSVTCPSR